MTSDNGYDPDEEDTFDDSDDEDDSPLEGNPVSQIHAVQAKLKQAVAHAKSAGKSRTVRTRPMTPKMAQKHPDVTVITMTRRDGRQLIFVRN